MARGIDVYERYQDVYNWNAVRNAGYSFAYIKVSDGVTTRSDGGYSKAAKAAGVLRGGYHYAQFGNPVQQADILVNQVEKYGATDLRPCLDIEHPFSANQTAVNFSIAFLNRIRQRGHLPCIYANNSMLAYLLPRIRQHVPDLFVWAARYANNYATAPTLRPSVAWDLHQFSQWGTVPGINGKTDLNDGKIPLNKQNSGPAPNLGRRPQDMGVPMPPGKSKVVTIPAAGLPPYLYIGFGYGAEMQVHEITAVGPTPGTAGANYKKQWKNVVWKADRPGPWRLPNDTRAVTIRYTFNANQTATGWVG